MAEGVDYLVACQTLTNFSHFLEKHKIAFNRCSWDEPWTIYEPEMIFESFEALLTIMQLKLDDIAITTYITIEFALRVPKFEFNHMAMRDVTGFTVTISEQGVFDLCLREQIRKTYDDVIKNPIKYYLDYEPRNKTVDWSKYGTPHCQFERVVEFKIRIKEDKQPHPDCITPGTWPFPHTP